MKQRSYTLLRLLQHGPLTLQQIVNIGGAGWGEPDVRVHLQSLKSLGCISGDRGERCYHLDTDIHEALRRLRAGEQRAGAPAGVAPVQPGVPGVRGAVHRRRQEDDLVVSAATLRAHDPDRRGLGRAWARRAAVARALTANLVAVVGVGA